MIVILERNARRLQCYAGAIKFIAISEYICAQCALAAIRT